MKHTLDPLRIRDKRKNLLHNLLLATLHGILASTLILPPQAYAGNAFGGGKVTSSSTGGSGTPSTSTGGNSTSSNTSDAANRSRNAFANIQTRIQNAQQNLQKIQNDAKTAASIISTPTVVLPIDVTLDGATRAAIASGVSTGGGTTTATVNGTPITVGVLPGLVPDSGVSTSVSKITISANATSTIDSSISAGTVTASAGGKIVKPDGSITSFNSGDLLPDVPVGSKISFTTGAGSLSAASGVSFQVTLPTGTAYSYSNASGQTTWSGVGSLTQKVSEGQTAVTVAQTAAQAVLNWNNFNISRDTTLTFDQQGNTDWIALNKIAPTGVPSQILGSIRADGQVYLINQNGIVFGAGSKVNTRSLVASALPINQALLDRGLLYGNPDASYTFTSIAQPAVGDTEAFTPPAAQAAASGELGDAAKGTALMTMAGGSWDTTYVGGTVGTQTGSIVVEVGAEITTTSDSSHNGGRVALIGPNVINRGSIATPDGQTILAAGQQVALMIHDETDTSLRGLDAYVGSLNPPGNSSLVTGSVVNTGIIEADRGNITLIGGSVYHSGELLSTTSVSLNGSIDISASYNADRVVQNSGAIFYRGKSGYILDNNTGLVKLDAGSIVQILPELSSTQTVTGSSLALQSQLNIVGQSIYIDGTILVPGGNNVGGVTIKAGVWFGQYLNSSTTGQIYLDSQALIDVSGVIDVASSVEKFIVEADLRAAELADYPTQLNGALRGEKVVFDARVTGLNADGSTWIGTPLADLTGWAALIESTVGELSANAGVIQMTAGKSVVIQQGASMNVSGGWVNYAGGDVTTTQVIDSNGGRYDISQAIPSRVYSGIYNGYTTTSSKWGGTSTYGVQHKYESGYIEGGNAGSITIKSPTVAFDGTVSGGTVIGSRQRQALPSSPIYNYAGTDITKLVKGAYLPSISKLTLNLFTEDLLGHISGSFPDVNIQAKGASTASTNAFGQNLAAPFSENSMDLSSERAGTVYIDAEIMGESGIGILTVDTGYGNIKVLSDIVGVSGGSLTLQGKSVDVEGKITIKGGNINLVAKDPALEGANGLALAANPDVKITLGAQGLLDVSGMVAGYSGASIIDGGSVTLSGYALDLQQGSEINADGGIEITPSGSIRRNGTGGKITINGGYNAVYVDENSNTAEAGAITLGSYMHAYAPKKGGSLSITAPSFRIGGASSSTGFVTSGNGLVIVDTDYFNSGKGGFSSLNFSGIAALNGSGTSIVEGAGMVISPGTHFKPVTQNSVLSVANGKWVLSPVLLPAYQQTPVSLSLSAYGLKNSGLNIYITGYTLMDDPSSSIVINPTYAGGAGSVTIGNPYIIAGDILVPGGKISLSRASATGLSYPYLGFFVLKSTSTISTAGSVVYASDTSNHLDSFSRLTGKILDGGNISIADNLLAESGSILDVSGASAFLDQLTSSLSNTSAFIISKNIFSNSGFSNNGYSRVQMDSNGGSITLAGYNMLYSDATLLGNAGGATANGGSLFVSSGRVGGANGVTLNIVQSGNVITTDILDKLTSSPLFFNGGNNTDGGYFAISRFTNGGFDNLTLGGYVNAIGNVTINAPGSVTIGGGQSSFLSVTADPNHASDPFGLTVNASYVKIGADFLPPLDKEDMGMIWYPTYSIYSGDIRTGIAPVTPTYGQGFLNITTTSEGLIDVGSLSLQNIGTANLTATEGDIRGNGTLVMAGDLTMTAGQIYPTTLSQFTIAVYDYNSGLSKGRVTFNPSGNRQMPLSAGGQLNVYASTIRQNGVLRAPVGTINLGDENGATAYYYSFSQSLLSTSMPSTSSLILGSGSVTSVSAMDASGVLSSIPYGTELNGINWYDPSGTDITSGSATPQKSIRISGADVDIQNGSTIDLSGGGDLFSYNWVKGLGGSKDILASNSSYAIIPGYQASYAPYTQVTNGSGTVESGWSGTSVGQVITLTQDVGSLKAGVYTLLPARYALLPGSYLVTLKNAVSVGTTISQADGSFFAPGYISNNLNKSAAASRAQSSIVSGTFEIASASVVKSRAEYDLYSANTAFTEGAVKNNSSIPRLPVDAGKLVLLATQSLKVNGQTSMGVPTGSKGLGGVVDIASSNDIVINSTGTGSSNSTLYLSATSLSSFGAQSLLVGGYRTLGSDGDVLTIMTGNLTVSNDVDHTLTGSDIILAASQNLTISDGSIIVQTGTASGNNLVLGNSSVTGSPTGTGNGVLLRVSGNSNSEVTRYDVDTNAAANLILGNARITSAGSIIVDSSNSTSLAPSTILSGAAVTIGSSRISLQMENPGTLQSSPGLVVSNQTLSSILSGAKAISLKSYTTLDVYGSGTIGNSNFSSLSLRSAGIRGFNNDGGTVHFKAQTILVSNADNVSLTGFSTLADGTQSANVGILSSGVTFATGALQFDCDTFQTGANTFSVAGYSDLGINANGGVLTQGTGGISTAVSTSTGVNGANIHIATPTITGSKGANQTLRSGGTLDVVDNGQTTSVTGGLGAKLTLKGTDVNVSSGIRLPSGSLTLEATSGNVTIGNDSGNNGNLDVSGTETAYYDKIEYTGGGQVNLISGSGSVILNSGGKISVAAPANGGNAGTLTVTATQGDFVSNGTLLGGASSALNPDDGLPLYQSGSFVMDVHHLNNPAGTTAQVQTVDYSTGAYTEGTSTITGGSLSSINAALDAGGFFQSRSFRVRNGNVIVDGSATAKNFTLAADNGSITVAGTINASGITGGAVNLYAYNGITLAGSGSSVNGTALSRGALLDVSARQYNSAGKGGSVNLETGSAKLIGDSLITGTGNIDIQKGSTINLTVAPITIKTSGGSSVINLATGGTVTFPGGVPSGNTLLTTASGFISDALGNHISTFNAGDTLSNVPSGYSITLNSAGTLTAKGSGGSMLATLPGGTLHLRAPQNSASTDLAINPINGTILNPSSIIVEGFQVFDLTPVGGVISNSGTTTQNKSGSVVTIASGTNVQGLVKDAGTQFATTNGTSIFNRLTSQWGTDDGKVNGALNNGMDALLHVQPGAELVSTVASTSIPLSLDTSSGSATATLGASSVLRFTTPFAEDESIVSALSGAILSTLNGNSTINLTSATSYITLPNGSTTPVTVTLPSGTNGGNLKLQSAAFSAKGESSVSLAASNNSLSNLSANTQVTLSGDVTSASPLYLSGSGTLTTSGANTTVFLVSVNSVSSSLSIPASGNVGARTLTVTNSAVSAGQLKASVPINIDGVDYPANTALPSLVVGATIVFGSEGGILTTTGTSGANLSLPSISQTYAFSMAAASSLTQQCRLVSASSGSTVLFANSTNSVANNNTTAVNLSLSSSDGNAYKLDVGSVATKFTAIPTDASVTLSSIVSRITGFDATVIPIAVPTNSTLSTTSVTLVSVSSGSTLTAGTAGALTFNSSSSSTAGLSLLAGGTLTPQKSSQLTVGRGDKIALTTGNSLAMPAGSSLSLQTAGTMTVNGTGYTVTSPAGISTHYNSGQSFTGAIGSILKLDNDSVGTLSVTSAITVVAMSSGSYTVSASGAYNSITAPAGSITLGTATGTAAGDWALLSYRYGPNASATGAGEPGVLTIRSGGDLIFYNSLSDGFNAAPTDTSLPSAVTTKTALWEATLLPAGYRSYEYRLVSGADFSGVNYHDVQNTPRLDGSSGSIKLGRINTAPYAGSPTSSSTVSPLIYASNTAYYYQTIRTGTGDISISSAGDVQLLNVFASIYTVGTQITNPTTVINAADFAVPPSLTATSQNSSMTNQSLGSPQETTSFYAAQYSVNGGNISIYAQNDIKHLTQTSATGPLVDDSQLELPTNWLNRRGDVDLATGLFTVNPGTNASDVASTTWWVDFRNFFEGIGALGGGNITLVADGNIRNIDAVIPTNARMAGKNTSGNAIAPNADNMIELGGGDITVRAGKNIDAGVYYVERGRGTLIAGDSIVTNATRSPNLASIATKSSLNSTGGTTPMNVYEWLPTTLFLGKGSFDVSASNDVLLGPVANVFLMPQGITNYYQYRTYFSTYDVDSSVNVSSLVGDISLRQQASQGYISNGLLLSWYTNVLGYSSSGSSALTNASNYMPWLRLNVTKPNITYFETVMELMPPSLSLIAYAGDINLTGSIILSPSATGSIDLIASGSINGLTVGGTAYSSPTAVTESIAWLGSTIIVSDANPDSVADVASPLAWRAYNANAQAQGLPIKSVYLDVLDSLFQETGMTSGVTSDRKLTLHGTSDSQGTPLHYNDENPIHIYALSGDVSGLELYSPKATQIMAGRDVSDIAFYIQNLHANDVSMIIAGRDILPYNDNSILRQQAKQSGNTFVYNSDMNPESLDYSMSGDIQISGPGTLEVLAGRNLNLGISPQNSTIVNGVQVFSSHYENGLGMGITSIGNERNPYLPATGADIIAAAGIGSSQAATTGIGGLDGSKLRFDAFISTFIDPFGGGTQTGRYLQNLADLMDMSGADNLQVWNAFCNLSREQKAMLSLDVFYFMMRDAGRDYNDPDSVYYKSYANAYKAISILFPDSIEWNGTMQLTSREIMTARGGNISLLVPGGSLLVGFDLGGKQPLDQGIMTQSGGNINILSDGNVEVGTSRIFTFKGGNEIIWSSKGNIAAGASSKTLQSVPPQRFTIDPQTGAPVLDLAGLATGGGIGVLETLLGAGYVSNIDLVAPTGYVDAGDAGIRVTGNLNIAALRVLNADNINVGGKTTGITVAASPDVAGVLKSDQSNTGNKAAATVKTSTPSVISVEVLGYGGGDSSSPSNSDDDERRKQHASL